MWLFRYHLLIVLNLFSSIACLCFVFHLNLHMNVSLSKKHRFKVNRMWYSCCFLNNMTDKTFFSTSKAACARLYCIFFNVVWPFYERYIPWVRKSKGKFTYLVSADIKLPVVTSKWYWLQYISSTERLNFILFGGKVFNATYWSGNLIVKRCLFVNCLFIKVY